MEITSTDIFAAIEKVIQTENTALNSSLDKDYDSLCNVLCDLQSIVDVVYRQENFNPELQDAYDIAKFVLVEMENKYQYGVWEANISSPSLRHTSAHTADDIRTLQEGSENETKIALARVNVLANMLGELSWEERHHPEEYKPAIENVNLTSVARFVSCMIAERMQKEENAIESTTDKAA